MVARHDHERRPVRVPNVRQQRREGRVGGRHLSVVRLARVVGVERRRRLVGRVRIEHVHPGEPGPGRLPVSCRPGAPSGNPRPRERHDLGGRPLGHRQVDRPEPVAEAVVIDVEPGVQAEAGMHGKRGHEGGGRIPGLLQHGGDRSRAGRQAVAAVLAQAVPVGVLARQDACVRGQRQHGVGVGEIEAHALGREPVDRGRRCRPPVRSERVRPERVDGDKKDVLPFDPAEIGLRTSRPEVDERDDGQDRRQAPGRNGRPRPAWPGGGRRWTFLRRACASRRWHTPASLSPSASIAVRPGIMYRHDVVD